MPNNNYPEDYPMYKVEPNIAYINPNFINDTNLKDNLHLENQPI